MNIEQVAFVGFGGDIVLHGDLYLPADADGPVAGVVMSHGFSAVKEMGLPAYAEAICAAGIAVLLYDHRCLGSSQGEPRQQINPWSQMRDMQSALTWLGDQPAVDAQRLGLWGSSFSGGEVLVLAAVEDRVRAVVANVPFAGIPGAAYDEDTAALVADISAELAGGTLANSDGASVMGPFAVVAEAGNELPPFLGQPESADWFLVAGAGTTWRNEVTLANAFGTEPAFDPGACAAHLRCPALFVVAAQDQVAEAAVALDAYKRAPEPKQLLVIEGHHFTPYSGAALATSSAAASSWFATHL